MDGDPYSILVRGRNSLLSRYFNLRVTAVTRVKCSSYEIAMAQDIHEIIRIPVLLERYTTDISRETVRFFEQEKGISLDQLLGWQECHPILYPWDAGYNSLRLAYNRAPNFFPKFLVLCKCTRDVQWALATALKLDIPFRIRAGAHDSHGFCLSNGIIIDVFNINYIDVCDDEVTMGAGVVIGALVIELSKYKRVLPTGTCQNVGIAGLSQGAGIGFLGRLYGLTLDSMLQAKVVLANGKEVTANSTTNKDLFWALRGGGGGSLGVVTEFTFRTYKLDTVVLFEMWFSFDDFEEVFRLWQEWSPHQSNSLTAELDLYPLKDKNRKFPILISGQYEGSRTKLREILRVWEDLYQELKIWRTTVKEAAIHHATPYPNFFLNFLNLFAVEPFTDKAITFLKRRMEIAPVGCSLEFDPLRGKVAEVGERETAFPWRDSLFWLLIRGTTKVQDDLPERALWVRMTYDGLLARGNLNEETGVGRLYVNFKDRLLSKEKYPLAYWGNNSRRLERVKERYDPHNVFNFEQSIPLPHEKERE